MLKILAEGYVKKNELRSWPYQEPIYQYIEHVLVELFIPHSKGMFIVSKMLIALCQVGLSKDCHKFEDFSVYLEL